MEKKGFIKYVLDYFNDVDGANDENTQKFLDVKTSDDRILRIGSEELEVGSTVQEIAEDGTLVDVDNGSFLLDDEKTTITIEDGVISNIETTEEDLNQDDSTEDSNDESNEELPKFKIVNKYTIQGMAILKQSWEIEIDQTEVKLGDALTITEDYEGQMNTYSLYSGTYELEDGRMITCNDEGIVILITDKDGNVLEAPAVGTDVDESQPEMSEDESEAFEKFNKLTVDYKELIVKFEKLEKDYKELAEKPSAQPTVIDGNFGKETVNSKAKSVLHNLMNL